MARFLSWIIGLTTFEGGAVMNRLWALFCAVAVVIGGMPDTNAAEVAYIRSARSD